MWLIAAGFLLLLVLVITIIVSPPADVRGFIDYHQGKDIEDDNPYCCGSVEHICWETRWLRECRRDYS